MKSGHAMMESLLSLMVLFFIALVVIPACIRSCNKTLEYKSQVLKGTNINEKVQGN